MHTATSHKSQPSILAHSHPHIMHTPEKMTYTHHVRHVRERSASVSAVRVEQRLHLTNRSLQELLFRAHRPGKRGPRACDLYKFVDFAVFLHSHSHSSLCLFLVASHSLGPFAAISSDLKRFILRLEEELHYWPRSYRRADIASFDLSENSSSRWRLSRDNTFLVSLAFQPQKNTSLLTPSSSTT